MQTILFLKGYKSILNQRKLWTTQIQITTIGIMIDPEKDPFYLLEKRVSDLISLSDKLSIENKALRSEQRKWTAERAALLQKNELAKSKIKTVLTRLKGMR